MMDRATLRDRVESETDEVVRIGGVTLAAAVSNLIDAKLALALYPLTADNPPTE